MSETNDAENLTRRLPGTHFVIEGADTVITNCDQPICRVPTRHLIEWMEMSGQRPAPDPAEPVGDGYVQNCILMMRDGDGPLFHGENLHPKLDGYAIIPRENYETILANQASVP